MTVLANSANGKPDKCTWGKSCKPNISLATLSAQQPEILNGYLPQHSKISASWKVLYPLTMYNVTLFKPPPQTHIHKLGPTIQKRSLSLRQQYWPYKQYSALRNVFGGNTTCQEPARVKILHEAITERNSV